MAVTDFIAAIELGSTEITGIAGKKNADGSIQIFAYASEHSSDCIKKGAIYNLDKTAQSLTVVINKLEEALQASIKKVYVGISGQSVRSIRNAETKQLNEETKISQALIDAIMESNREIPLIDQEILAVEPQEYKVGNNLLTDPVGIPADKIEGHFLNIIARNSLKSNLKQCFRQTGYEVADYVLSPLATANIVLSSSEKRSGCVLIDFGADTTTVSVYKNNLLRHLAVIPLGSNNVTKDICSLQIEEEDAELLKLRYASAYTEPTESEEDANKEYSLDGKPVIRARKLEDIVEARVNEIISNVWNQIKLSEYSDKLLAGAILTGGASKMPNLDKAFTRLTGIEKVRIALSGEAELRGNVQIPQDGTRNTLLGLLAAGKENCCKIDPRKGHQLDFIDDLKKKEEEEKQKAEEAMRKAEEEKRRIEDEERKRQLEEAKLRQEQERQQKRLADCEMLMKEATRLMNRKEYKAALAKAEEAGNMNLAEKAEDIAALTAEIKKQKEENNPFKRFFDRLKNGADEILKD